MRLASLEIQSLRVLEAASVRPGPSVNVFVGPNGSGKTSILEGIHLLGLGRSFRSRRVADVVRRGEDTVRVLGEVEGDSGKGSRRLGVEQGPRGLRIRCQGQEVKTASALARELPLVLVSPDSARLLTDGTALRRGLLDWLLFHVEPGFLEVHQRYRRALRQRNAGLRGGEARDLLGVWEQELGSLGHSVHEYRLASFESWIPFLDRALEALMRVRVETAYRPGWDVEAGLGAILEASLEGDRRAGYTRTGPHRGDLRFSVDGRPARDVLSRGEAKLFVMAVYIALARYLADATGRPPIALIDELASELDDGARQRVFEALRALGVQSFVTAVSPDLVAVDGGPRRVFHVERGQVSEVI